MRLVRKHEKLSRAIVFFAVITIRSFPLRNRIWAEDGLFLSNFSNNGWRSFDTIYGGYRQLGYRVLLSLLHLVPPVSWAFAIWFLAALIWATVAYLVSVSVATTMAGKVPCLIAGLAVVLNGPAASDALGNLSSGSHILVGAMLVVLSIGSFSKKGWISVVTVAFILTLTNPVIALCLPVIIFRAARHNVSRFIAAISCATIFLAALFEILGYQNQIGRHMRLSDGMRFGDFTWDIMLLIDRPIRWLHLPLSQDMRFKCFLVLLVILILARSRSVFAYFKREQKLINSVQSRGEQIFLLCYSFASVNIAYSITSGIQDRHQVTGALILVVLVLVLMVESLESKSFRRFVLVPLFTILAIGNLLEFSTSQYSKSGPKWSQEIGRGEKLCASEKNLQQTDIAISPPTPVGMWIVQVPCQLLR